MTNFTGSLTHVSLFRRLPKLISAKEVEITIIRTSSIFPLLWWLVCTKYFPTKAGLQFYHQVESLAFI
jgi:hypothetical protein